MRKVSIIASILVLISALAAAQKVPAARFSVNAGKTERTDALVSAALEGIHVNDSLDIELYETVRGKEIPVRSQVENGVSPVLWWIMGGKTAQGAVREYKAYLVERKKTEHKIKVNNTGDLLRISSNGKPVLDYNLKLVYPPRGVDTMYRRNGFIHPLFSPSGNILTQISPKDHYHHVGIWNPWTRVKTGGHVTDFWNLYSHQGTVRFAGINSISEGDVFSGFSVRQEHVDFQGKKPEEITINEVWDIRVYDADPATGKAWIVDVSSFLSVPGTSDIVLEAYRYGGGIGFRATADWDKNNSWVSTSEGKTRVNADGSRARWTDTGGMFKNGTESGIVFMSHPTNRQHPEPMRVWPLEQNGRGDLFFEFCPIRYKEWILSPGRIYSQKYRMLVYDGRITATEAERIWQDFANPPAVTRIKTGK